MEKGFKQFLIKTGIFVALFIAFSFLIGTKLYANNLLEGWKIGIYGRVGYILLFSIAGFILVYREKLVKFEKFKRKTIDFVFIAISFLLLAGFYIVEINAGRISLNTMNIILVHLLGISIFIFLILGIYGWSFIKYFVNKFKRELLYFLIFGIIVYSLMNLVLSLWPYLSLVVMKVTQFLLGLISSNIQIIGDRTIIFEGFGAEIAEACSGIYSIFIFSALYLFTIFLDWDKMNKKKAALVFLPAVLGAFLVNIIRVFLLFVIGAYISRDIALGMYHSYVGMIFFLLYFGLFWGFLHRWMKKK
jgi:exosortase/archaeosortase family protein